MAIPAINENINSLYYTNLQKKNLVSKKIEASKPDTAKKNNIVDVKA
ncbi:hypothetical protein [Pelosinus propionicus]|uniref:Uncharacterized protein n=1 Tax=Pelosinus propionicus DSM 13327 TaxID=1123291 RepID=A0A1I4HIX2_9FIRM|nr:hypothetical protein [Pelosinus propionicus]SFL42135.1 hypothetical protein SAMN04490355_100427 [Pelosinus propionicus DSM 13327]